MWNSGGKNIWSKAGRGIFGTRSEAGRAVPIYGAGDVGKYMTTQEGEIGDLRSQLVPVGNTVWNRALDLDTGEASEERLWDVQSRRLLESLRPGLAARGLATSGPGFNIEAEKLGDLSAEFTSRAFDRNIQREQLVQQAAQGLAMLKSLPLELRQQLISAILNQSMTSVEGRGGRKSILEMLGGGSGIGSLISSGGGG